MNVPRSHPWLTRRANLWNQTGFRSRIVLHHQSQKEDGQLLLGCCDAWKARQKLRPLSHTTIFLWTLVGTAHDPALQCSCWTLRVYTVYRFCCKGCMEIRRHMRLFFVNNSHKRGVFSRASLAIKVCLPSLRKSSYAVELLHYFIASVKYFKAEVNWTHALKKALPHKGHCDEGLSLSSQVNVCLHPIVLVSYVWLCVGSGDFCSNTPYGKWSIEILLRLWKSSLRKRP